MSGGWQARAEAAGEAAAARMRVRLAERLGEAVPGARVTLAGDGVAITGRRLREEPALRWPGGLLR